MFNHRNVGAPAASNAGELVLHHCPHADCFYPSFKYKKDIAASAERASRLCVLKRLNKDAEARLQGYDGYDHGYNRTHGLEIDRM